MKKKRLLKSYHCAKVKRGDLVLMEMRVRKRFDSRDSSLEKKDKPFRIAFQLNSLYMLREGEEIDNDEDVEYSF
jgi:hypothetical protein